MRRFVSTAFAVLLAIASALAAVLVWFLVFIINATSERR